VARISVSYILLCGKVILPLTVLLLQCLEGIHSQNSDTSGQRATTAAFIECVTCTELYEYRPPSPVVLCSYLPEEFIYCQDPVNHAQNSTAILEMGHSCWKVCQTVVDRPSRSHSICVHLHDIECAGPREFLRGNEPCIKYTGHYFITLLYSFFLGCFGVDQFCLGHTGTAVGKLLTLGGLGIRWFVDFIITGGLMPSDNSNWCTFY
uniref:TM2 domain-containing protein 2 n=1 Tax=Salmo trutta TaxID=8032 RepID=A0A673Y2R1_SALTR